MLSKCTLYLVPAVHGGFWVDIQISTIHFSGNITVPINTSPTSRFPGFFTIYLVPADTDPNANTNAAGFPPLAEVLRNTGAPWSLTELTGITVTMRQHGEHTFYWFNKVFNIHYELQIQGADLQLLYSSTQNSFLPGCIDRIRSLLKPHFKTGAIMTGPEDMPKLEKFVDQTALFMHNKSSNRYHSLRSLTMLDTLAMTTLRQGSASSTI